MVSKLSHTAYSLYVKLQNVHKYGSYGNLIFRLFAPTPRNTNTSGLRFNPGAEGCALNTGIHCWMSHSAILPGKSLCAFEVFISWSQDSKISATWVKKL